MCTYHYPPFLFPYSSLPFLWDCVFQFSPPSLVLLMLVLVDCEFQLYIYIHMLVPFGPELPLGTTLTLFLFTLRGVSFIVSGDWSVLCMNRWGGVSRSVWVSAIYIFMHLPTYFFLFQCSNLRWWYYAVEWRVPRRRCSWECLAVAVRVYAQVWVVFFHRIVGAQAQWLDSPYDVKLSLPLP